LQGERVFGGIEAEQALAMLIWMTASATAISVWKQGATRKLAMEKRQCRSVQSIIGATAIFRITNHLYDLPNEKGDAGRRPYLV
jgi:hypothetical protein